MTHSNTNPRSGQYLTHARSHITWAVAAMNSCLRMFTSTKLYNLGYIIIKRKMLPLKPVPFIGLTAAFSTSSRVFILPSQRSGSVLFGGPKYRTSSCLRMPVFQTHHSSFISAHFHCLQHQSKSNLLRYSRQ